MMRCFSSLSVLLLLSAFSLQAWDDYGECSEPCYPHPEHFSIYGEGLYWVAEEENLPFVLETKAFEDFTTTPNNLNFKDQEKRFGALKTPGFRVGIGAMIPYTAWTSDVRWTHLSGLKQKSVHGTLTSPSPVADFDFFVPILSPVATVALRVVHGHWRLGVDTIQWTLGKSFDYCDSGQIRPFAGFKYDRIGQKVRIHGIKDVQIFATDALVTTNIKLRSRYVGGGILVGTHANLNMGLGFGIYSELALGLTYGYYDVKGEQFSTATGNATPQNLKDKIKTFDHTGRGNVDFAIGLDWRYTFLTCDSLTPIELILRVGYDYHQYFNQNFLYSSVLGGISCGGDLILQGLTFGGGISF